MQASVTAAATGNMPNSAGVLRIGGNSVWGEWFAGLIDEVRIYRRALTQAEIQTDMGTPVGGGPGCEVGPDRVRRRAALGTIAVLGVDGGHVHLGGLGLGDSRYHGGAGRRTGGDGGIHGGADRRGQEQFRE